MRLGLIGIGTCALAISSAASSADFGYTYTSVDNYTAGSPVTESGILYGLGLDGYYTPTRVDAVDPSPQYVFKPLENFTQFTGGFFLEDGQITGADFALDSGDPGCFSGCGISISSDSGVFEHFGHAYSRDSFSDIAFFRITSPAPEPATWLLMFLGVALTGWMLRSGGFGIGLLDSSKARLSG